MLSNADIAELLLQLEAGETGHRRRALHGAARAAMFWWQEEAGAIVERGDAITGLWRVGPWLARTISGWLADPPEVPETPPARRGYLTRAEVVATLEGHDEWRTSLRADLQMHTTHSDGK